MGGSREISRTSNDYRDFFARIDTNSDNLLTKDELGASSDDLSSSLIPFIEKLSSESQNDKTLELWQYLQFANDFEQKQLFNEAQVNWANKEYVLERILEDARDYQRMDPLLKSSYDLAWAALSKDIRAYSFIAQELKNDKVFLAESVKYRPEIVELIDQQLLTDISFIAQILNNNGAAYRYLPLAQADKQLTLLAVSNYGFALQHSSAELQNDSEVVLAAVRNRGTALRFAPGLNDNFQIVEAAVESDGSSLEFASQRLKNNVTIVQKSIQQDGMYLKFAGVTPKADFETALMAVKDQGIVLGLVSESLRDNQDIVSAAVQNNAFALYYASDRLINDASFIQYLFTLNWNLLLKQKVRTPLIGEKRIYPNPCYEIVRQSLPLTTITEYEKTLEQLMDLNIEHYERFKTLEDAKSIIAYRQELPADLSNKHAVIIYPKYDGSGAFESNNSIHQLLENNYEVYYFEIAKDIEIEPLLSTITTQLQGINFLTFGGHGIRTHLSFGEHDPAISKKGKEVFYLDTADNNKIDISSYLQSNARIFLESCSSGQGEDRLPNVANTVDHISGYKCDIIAPELPTRIKGYRFDEQGQVTGMDFYIGTEKTYIIDN